MTRPIHPDTIAALGTDNPKIAALVEFNFDPVLRITDKEHDLIAMSNTWQSSSHLLGISEAAETSEVRINSLTVELSAVDQTYVAIFLNNDYHDIQTRIWMAVLDDIDQVIGDPILFFDGNIDGLGIDDGEQSSVMPITIASHWANFEARAGRRTNHNDQQRFYAGDMGFEFASDTVKDIKWGRG